MVDMGLDMTPVAAVNEARRRKVRFIGAEPIIANDADQALIYARDIIQGRFELAEPLFAKTAYHSLQYASNILERFELGEPVIATSPRHSYQYAYMCLDDRFEMGEAAIATNEYFSFKYARDILKGPFKLGESVISRNSEQLYYYLIGVPNTYNIDLVLNLLKSKYARNYIHHYLRGM